jgi:hypothetical protein
MSLNRGSWIDHPSMVIDMNDAKLVTLEQLRGFLAGAVDRGLTPNTDPAARYEVIKLEHRMDVQRWTRSRIRMRGQSGDRRGPPAEL